MIRTLIIRCIRISNLLEYSPFNNQAPFLKSTDLKMYILNSPAFISSYDKPIIRPVVLRITGYFINIL